MIPILQRIRDSAGTTARKFGTVASVAATDDYTFPNHRRFALPTPEPLTPQLLALGVDECSASRISSALLRVSLLLRRDFETGVQRLLRTQNHSSAVLSTFVTIYKRTIQQWTSYLLDDITPRVLRAQSLHRSLGEPSATEFIERKRPFNASAIPILEQFFEQNAFPSRLEKIELASKCDMDFKQIHIWFQNRRTRLRKEGKEPKRSQNNALLQELEKTVLDTLLPAEPEEHDDSDQSCRKLIRTPIAPSFDIVTPPHAFPSPYPPICSYDPFPEQARRSFELPWLRSALAVQKPRSDVVVDMDELTTAFASLALSTEEPEKCEAPNTLSPLSCTTYLTPCPPAPLPALLRFGHHSFPATLTERRIRSPRADPRFGRTFHPVGSQPSSYRSQRKAKQSVQSPRQCLSSSNSLPPSPRCKRSLPRRVPRNLPSWAPYSLCEGNPPATSRQSSALSQVSDSTIGGSDVDSPLSTPPDLPISLPLVHDCVSDLLSSHPAMSQVWKTQLRSEFATCDSSKPTQRDLVVPTSLI